MRKLIVASALLVAGCSSSTGVLPLGPDTYTVSERYAPILGGVSKAEKVALTEASQYCDGQGRKFLPVAASQGGPVVQEALYGPTRYTVTFRCLLPGDPALVRPTLEQSNTIMSPPIEH